LRRSDERRTETRCESGAAGDVVGVGVGVERPCDPQTELCGERLVCVRESGRVDQRRSAVADVDEIGGVAEALVDELVDPHDQPPLPSASACSKDDLNIALAQLAIQVIV
jgi:hypothetical protein